MIPKESTKMGFSELSEFFNKLSKSFSFIKETNELFLKKTGPAVPKELCNNSKTMILFRKF